MSKFWLLARGATDYILIVALIVIAGIAVFSLFGDVVPGISVQEGERSAHTEQSLSEAE